MIILVGKTCSGKSTVANILHEKYGYSRIITYTTRPPRDGEQDGVEYHFISLEEFERLKSEEFFFETTSYSVATGETWYYGTSKESLHDNAVIVMNPDGLKKAKNLLDPDKYHLKIFYLNIREGYQYNRLRQRGDNSDETSRRVEADKKDFADIENYYDYAISTDLMTPNDVAELIDKMMRFEEKEEEEENEEPKLYYGVSCWCLC